jgi:hypothetical protein
LNAISSEAKDAPAVPQTQPEHLFCNGSDGLGVMGLVAERPLWARRLLPRPVGDGSARLAEVGTIPTIFTAAGSVLMPSSMFAALWLTTKHN